MNHPVAEDGVELIAVERRRQRTAERYTQDHDDHHTTGDLAMAAIAYAVHASSQEKSCGWTESMTMDICLEQWWPWDSTEFKPGDQVRDLVKAGALIAAEIDRLQRKPDEVNHVS